MLINEAALMKKKCPSPEDEDLVLFVYDKTLGRADCEEIWDMLMKKWMR
jgi:hypothetical protein